LFFFIAIFHLELFIIFGYCQALVTANVM